MTIAQRVAIFEAGAASDDADVEQRRRLDAVDQHLDPDDLDVVGDEPRDQDLFVGDGRVGRRLADRDLRRLGIAPGRLRAWRRRRDWRLLARRLGGRPGRRGRLRRR